MHNQADAVRGLAMGVTSCGSGRYIKLHKLINCTIIFKHSAPQLGLFIDQITTTMGGGVLAYVFLGLTYSILKTAIIFCISKTILYLIDSLLMRDARPCKR